jgi:hypothetical protein
MRLSRENVSNGLETVQWYRTEQCTDLSVVPTGPVVSV